MKRLQIVCVPLLLAVSSSLSWGQSPNQNRNSGLGIGAVMGAVTGGLIGDRNNEAVAGAAIGAAVGGLTGAVIGTSVDNQVVVREQLAGQRVVAQQMAQAVTVPDVIAMTQSRLSDSVIITQIRTNGVAQQLQAPDLVMLSNAGVSDNVIQAMQTAPLANVVAPVPAQPVYQDRVIVEQRYVVPAPRPYPVWHRGYYYHPRPHFYGPPPPPHRPGVTWGFSISN